ncbi:hypothetical protein AB0D49_23030 [Streptomyces sp. NPDC048290]|uniref:hypothetical protein n=1 Tax=Streptomyces sp. NPDC048290 TaxID=3155811 RepID=UPI0034353F65
MTALDVPRHRMGPPCLRCRCVALDLGSARARAWVSGHGLVPAVPFPGAEHPVRRGDIVDVPGAARLIDRLVGGGSSRATRPLVVVTTPVMSGPGHRERVRAAVRVLRPRAVLTVPGARAVAVAAGADLTRPLLVVDIGAHLAEVVLLVDGAVHDARRTALGTGDLGTGTAPADLAATVVTMIGSMLRQDRTALVADDRAALVADALDRGALLAGGGALRPDLVHRLTVGPYPPPRPVPAPHTAAVRGAAELLRSAHIHPSAGGAAPSLPCPG